MKKLRIVPLLLIAACSSNGSTVDSSISGDAAVSPVDCSAATTKLEQVVCQASGFLGTLSSTELATANPAFTDTASRTKWSNLPTSLVSRAGIAMGSLSATSQAAALALMQSLLSSDGASDLAGVRAADDYLVANGGNSGGGPGGGLSYGANLYYVAVFGTPSATGNWAVMFGGHHMAYNITFTNGVGYPTPNHLGVEPKAPFSLDGSTYSPMADEGNAMVAIFNGLDTTQLQTAYLQGQTFADVLIGPVEYGKGSSELARQKYPTGANRTGILVSALSSAQQALVTAAIQQWASDFDPAIADSLVAAYTADTAYQDTYVAWGGPQQGSAVSVDVNGEYMRIDGPRVWIELACQSGVIIQNATHYHSIYRDKSFDYANTL